MSRELYGMIGESPERYTGPELRVWVILDEERKSRELHITRDDSLESYTG